MELRPPLSKLLRALQIVIGAFATGPLLFLGVVIFLRMRTPESYADGQLFTYAATLFAAACVGMSAFVPRLITANARQQIAECRYQPSAASGKLWNDLMEQDPETGRWFGAFQTATIMGGAMLEAGALFACVAYLLEGHPLAIGVAGAMILLIVALQLPTANKFTDWREDQRRAME